jgi:hypothetical protein
MSGVGLSCGAFDLRFDALIPSGFPLFPGFGNGGRRDLRDPGVYR